MTVLNMVPVGTQPAGTVVQTFNPKPMLAVVMSQSPETEGFVCVQRIGGGEDRWPEDRDCHVIDVEGMAAEMERLDARGTEARLCLLASFLARKEITLRIPRDVLERIDKYEFRRWDILPDGSRFLGVAQR